MRWEDPSRHDAWSEEANALRSNPNTWAVIVEGQPNAAVLALNIRRGRLSAFRPVGAFDAKVRRGAVYAIYLGEPS